MSNAANPVDSLPELAIVRVLTPGGPYRAGDDLSLALGAGGVARLVAHDAAVRANCMHAAANVVPEMLSVAVVHRGLLYAVGDVLTLSFVDPHIARVHVSAASLRTGAPVTIAPEPADAAARRACKTETDSDDPAASNPLPATVLAEPLSCDGSATDDRALGASAEAHAEQPAQPSEPYRKHPTEEGTHRGFASRDDASPHRVPGEVALQTYRSNGVSLQATTPEASSAQQRWLQQSDVAVRVDVGVDVAQPSSGERSSIESPADFDLARLPVRPERPAATSAPRSPTDRGTIATEAAADESRLILSSGHPPLPDRTAEVERGTVLVRLNWSAERARRFVSVVDKLFTIDRLGWYRHAFAMRLLIPDELLCESQTVRSQGNAQLQELRAAAVSVFGKPLLAACMPNFTVTGEWLESMDSSAEVRAAAGLRETLVAYVVDASPAIPSSESNRTQTIGYIARGELLEFGAPSVDAFLPVLIPAFGSDGVFSRSLYEYRRLLVDLFGQTARAGEAVRLNAMTQANHSLDDRLWQLVGATVEACDGFVIA